MNDSAFLKGNVMRCWVASSAGAKVRDCPIMYNRLAAIAKREMGEKGSRNYGGLNGCLEPICDIELAVCGLH